MRYLLCLFAALGLILGPAVSPVSAQDRSGEWTVRVTETVEWIEEGDPRFETAQDTIVYETAATAHEEPRLAYQTAGRAIASRRANTPTALAAFGPFRILSPKRAALVGATDAASPGQFAALLRAFPDIETLDFVEAPGTEHDRANLTLGRMIRAAGLTTRVPGGGSVRSGAVELFVAGAQREIEDGAQFAVHSWRDSNGLEASDFAAGSPEHRSYLAYYREMGMSEDGARAFYDMTNSVRHARALWLDAEDMRGWLARTVPHDDAAAPAVDVAANDNTEDGADDHADVARVAANDDAVAAPPRIAYLDVGVAAP